MPGAVAACCNGWDAADEIGCTPMQCTAVQGHYEAAGLLVASLCHVDARNTAGKRPMDRAVLLGDQNIVELLKA